jgi:riboflavin kinase/FMN adenylyltransferase
VVAVLTFTYKLARLSAREFLSLVKKHLSMRGILVGPDFALGKSKEGDVDMLRSLGGEMRFTVGVMPPFRVNGETVSSTLIRGALAEGDMRKVTRLMERHFYLEGKVISAEKRGQILGYPTANLDVERQQALPGNGIYATIAQVEGSYFHSATNVGTRPTFGEGEEMVETHLLNYKGNLYGKDMRVEFVEKLRNEERFRSSEELKAQIEKDIREVEAILAKDLK